jgi:hypothetical protein
MSGTWLFVYGGKKMNNKRLAGIVILILIFIMSCSGKYGNLKTQPKEDSKVTQRELVDTWTIYNINFTRDRYERSDRPFNATIIVFDPKTDERKILLGNNWSAVKDQETWTKIVNANVTSQGNFVVGPNFWPNYPDTYVQRLSDTNNQLYGYIIRPSR